MTLPIGTVITITNAAATPIEVRPGVWRAGETIDIKTDTLKRVVRLNAQGQPVQPGEETVMWVLEGTNLT